MVVAEVSSGQMTERVRKLKDELLHTRPKVSTERLIFLMEAYRETEGELPVVRRALLLDKQLRGKEIFIDDNPIVGTATGYPVGAEFYPEWSTEAMVPGQEFATSLGETILPEDIPEEEIVVVF